jgi:hypothetical protein
VLQYEELVLSEAVPAPSAPYLDPCCGPPLSGGSSGRAAGLVEAFRRAGKAAPGVLPEVADAEASLARRIRAHLARGRIEVTLTDNRYTMISVRRLGRGRSERRYEVRLHHMFADADPVIMRALARYIADNDADASRILGDFIDANSGHVRGRARRAPSQLILTAGDHHDLRAIFDELNVRYFGDKIDAAITWGARTGRPRRRNSIKMGSYSVEDRLIRIHRSLDRAFVPRYFVAWIVFHEMLHQVHDIRVKNGRREFHSKEFLADEAGFEAYAQARHWERAHLDALLTY